MWARYLEDYHHALSSALTQGKRPHAGPEEDQAQAGGGTGGPATFAALRGSLMSPAAAREGVGARDSGNGASSTPEASGDQERDGGADATDANDASSSPPRSSPKPSPAASTELCPVCRQGSDSSLAAGPKECAICSEPLGAGDVEDGEDALGHVFACCHQRACIVCAGSWIRAWANLPGQRARIRQAGGEARPTCPFCRTELGDAELNDLLALSGTTLEEILGDDDDGAQPAQPLEVRVFSQRGTVHPDFSGPGGGVLVGPDGERVIVDVENQQALRARVHRGRSIYRYTGFLRWAVFFVIVIVVTIFFTA